MLFAQSPTQTIKGVVLDRDTKQPLIGATVQVADLELSIGTITDFNGSFVLENVPVGRHTIECQYLGYDAFSEEGIVLNAAKELTMNIELIESVSELQEVVVSAFKGNEPLNELAVVSTRSFSVEETQRYPASVNDPGRMAMGLPGVQPSRDTRSDVVIRGNSSVGLLWRLNGVDIPNPNHFARRGSSGGGITIFSISMLSNSDFSTGAFPAEYGNAFSGVFDLKFRKGNMEDREYTFRAGILGLDFSTEGPIKKGRSSYLVNYRYSTLGILNSLGFFVVGPRTNNTFQDLSFNLHFESENRKSQLDFWGMGGLSSEIFSEEEDLNPTNVFDDYLTRDNQTNMAAVGLSHTYLIDDKSYLKTTLAVMGQTIDYLNDTINVETLEAVNINEERYDQNRLSLATYYSRKINPKVALKAGAFASLIGYDLFQDSLSYLTNERDLNLAVDGTTTLIQPWFQFRFRPTARLTINAGLHAQFFALNNTSSMEPRLGLAYKLNERQTLSFAYGLHSRILPLGAYFPLIPAENQPNTFTITNEDLALIKAHHLVVAYDHKIGNDIRFHIEAYYQYLFDVPVAADPNNNYWLLNDIDGYPKIDLVSEGTGRNYGVDISLEKAFREGTFFIASGSIFESQFQTLNDDTWKDTRYNTGWSFTFMGGKEWALRNNGVLQLGLRILSNGGMRLPTLTSNKLQNGDSRIAPLADLNLYGNSARTYFRPDGQFAYRKDKAGRSWRIALDIQNLISRQNDDGIEYVYDDETLVWDFRKQSGLTPILSFQIDW